MLESSRRPVVPPPRRPAVQEDPGLSEVTVAGTGLRMKAPTGWSFVRNPGPVQARCRPRNARGDLPVILVQAGRVQPGLSLRAIVSGFTRQIPRALEDPVLFRDEEVPVELEQVGSYEVACRGRLDGRPVTMVQRILHRGGWVVVVTFISSPAGLKKHEPAFRQLLESLQW